MTETAAERADRLHAQLVEVVDAPVTELHRLSGGASRETWSFRGGDRPLICQRLRAGGGTSAVTSFATEVSALRAASAAGVPVPEVVHDASSGDQLGTPGMVVSWLDGETVPRRLLRDAAFASSRERLADDCGQALAAIHRIPADSVVGLMGDDQLELFTGILSSFEEPHPILELGARWLGQHRPRRVDDRRLVHGDFRLGNLLVDERGLVAVLDWELVHAGDPMEDLGWLCYRAWRFGSNLPVAGVGEREALYEAYERAGGAVDRPAVRWWEVMAAFRWGGICLMQVASHLHGLSRSVELAAIGRRTAEAEYDLLLLLLDRAPR